MGKAEMTNAYRIESAESAGQLTSRWCIGDWNHPWPIVSQLRPPSFFLKVGVPAVRVIYQQTFDNGQKVTVSLVDRVYNTGRKYAADFKAIMKRVFGDHVPR
jgi:hypothetical protein